MTVIHNMFASSVERSETAVRNRTRQGDRESGVSVAQPQPTGRRARNLALRPACRAQSPIRIPMAHPVRMLRKWMSEALEVEIGGTNARRLRPSDAHVIPTGMLFSSAVVRGRAHF